MSSNRLVPALAAAGAAVLVVSGCSSGYKAIGTHTAVVQINGVEVGEPLPVRCEQVRWDWRIETLEETPGFTALVQTGDTVVARGVMLERLGGFTGSYWDGTVGSADAEVTNRTFRVTGTAKGYYLRDPSDTTTAEFVIRTDC
ncbi:lipoprotein LpqH [Mycobacterium sp. IDR2000157661]|uniref:lipoprotein LpqH n=1 Tax=Mycobacterium sp. IDR2000157661 TaxID=2867005 RepID=UPI001EEB1EBF|nr:lipoprotein LpqH [Mycobacterium sp. IDR2000157661]ULE34509.1 lipoprotein LpqH [Mycobacterium sp. IDR2000157661]